jgi:hypothetical protein
MEEKSETSTHETLADSLPISILVIIFEKLLRAPTPHPSFLEFKVQASILKKHKPHCHHHNVLHTQSQAWSSIYRVCKLWRAAILETEVGVCLPKEINLQVSNFLRTARIRGLELHDPDHCDVESLSKLLCDSKMIAASGNSLLTIVDAPFNGKWQPSAFKNLSQVRLFNLT